MKIGDTIAHAWGNLWKKKLRTCLTTAGVMIGIGALVCMFAFGQGVQRNIKDQFEALELFNYIVVSVRSTSPKTPSDSNDLQTSTDPNMVLNDDFLLRLQKIEGVEAVFPEMRFPAQIRWKQKEVFTLVQVVPAATCQSGFIQLRTGRVYTTDEPNELMISDTLLRRLGCRQPETALDSNIIIRTLTLNFNPMSLFRLIFHGGRLPFSHRSYAFRITGVVERMGFGGPLPIKSDVFIPAGPAEKMKKLELTSIWDFFKPTDRPGTYATVSVKVRSPKYVTSVKQALEDLGLKTFALMDNMEEMKKGFLIMDMFLLAVGMIGITVASLGIVNTMVMSILERFREIGIMKAVGATDRDVQRIFLFESGMIGFWGGVFGLLLARVVSFVINEVINGFSAREGVPYIHYFHFAWWLCAGAILFSVLVSLIAGLYPTRRAAQVDPVVALRHD